MGYIVLPVLLLVVLVTIGGIVLSTSWQIQDSRVLNAELVDTVGKNFDEMNLSIKELLNFITMDSDLQAMMREDVHGTILWMEHNLDIKRILSNKALLMDNVQGVYLFDTEGRIRTFWHRNTALGFSALYPTVDRSWFDPIGRVTSRMDCNRLIYLRKINSMEDLAPVGYALMLYDSQVFDVQFNRLVQRNERSMIITDGYGEIVTHTLSSEAEARGIVRHMQTLPEGFAGKTYLPAGSSALVAQYASPLSGWKVYSLIDLMQARGSFSALIQGLLGLGLVALALGAVFSVWLVRRSITHPIQQIMEMMRSVDSGDYTQRLSIHTGDELEDLAGSINEMLTRTDTLINQVLKDKLYHRELQLDALQAQINPHLLHNSLECINWLAEFGRKDDIRTVTLALAKLMQSLNDNERVVPLEQELDYTRHFLRIYEVLLEGRLSYTVVCNVAAQLRIPRLTIQPLVENAVIHGIKQSLSPGYINISVTDTAQGILVNVTDDGVGMTDAQVKAINDFARGETGGEELGVGIRNVVQRLRLFYGDQTRLHCTSHPAWGTSIDMILPYDSAAAEEADENNSDR